MISQETASSVATESPNTSNDENTESTPVVDTQNITIKDEDDVPPRSLPSENLIASSTSGIETEVNSSTSETISQSTPVTDNQNRTIQEKDVALVSPPSENPSTSPPSTVETKAKVSAESMETKESSVAPITVDQNITINNEDNVPKASPHSEKLIDSSTNSIKTEVASSDSDNTCKSSLNSDHHVEDVSTVSLPSQNQMISPIIAAEPETPSGSIIETAVIISSGENARQCTQNSDEPITSNKVVDIPQNVITLPTSTDISSSGKDSSGKSLSIADNQNVSTKDDEDVLSISPPSHNPNITSPSTIETKAKASGDGMETKANSVAPEIPKVVFTSKGEEISSQSATTNDNIITYSQAKDIATISHPSQNLVPSPPGNSTRATIAETVVISSDIMMKTAVISDENTRQSTHSSDDPFTSNKVVDVPQNVITSTASTIQTGSNCENTSRKSASTTDNQSVIMKEEDVPTVSPPPSQNPSTTSPSTIEGASRERMETKGSLEALETKAISPPVLHSVSDLSVEKHLKKMSCSLYVIIGLLVIVIALSTLIMYEFRMKTLSHKSELETQMQRLTLENTELLDRLSRADIDKLTVDQTVATLKKEVEVLNGNLEKLMEVETSLRKEKDQLEETLEHERREFSKKIEVMKPEKKKEDVKISESRMKNPPVKKSVLDDDDDDDVYHSLPKSSSGEKKKVFFEVDSVFKAPMVETFQKWIEKAAKERNYAVSWTSSSVDYCGRLILRHFIPDRTDEIMKSSLKASVDTRKENLVILVKKPHEDTSVINFYENDPNVKITSITSKQKGEYEGMDQIEFKKKVWMFLNDCR